MLHDLFIIFPELLLLVFALAALLLDLFFGKRFPGVSYATVQIGLILSIFFSLFTISNTTEYAFSNLFVLDRFAAILKIFVELTSIIAFLYGRRYVEERKFPQGEYYVLALLSVLGMLIVISANHLLTLYLGVELMSLPVYVMVGLWREKIHCVEAAMKYFVMGAIASGLLLYGLSLLFGITGSMEISQIANAIANGQAPSILLVFSMIFIIAGIVFKLGGAPFHLWVPDVYEGAPSSVTLFIATAPKLAAFALVVRFLDVAYFNLAHQWHDILIVVAVASMAIGNTVAMTQQNLKRMLAYSSIAHIGYMTLGFVAGGAAGFSAALFYMLSYTLTGLGAFGILVILSGAGFDLEMISDCRGLSQRQPWLSFLLMLILFSLAGVPPLVGFIAKVGILEALIDSGQTTLAVVAIIFAIIGVYYYLRVVKVMYFEPPENRAMILSEGGWSERFIMSLNGLAVVALGIFPSALFLLCHSVF